MKKRLLAVTLILVMCFCAACGSAAEPAATTEAVTEAPVETTAEETTEEFGFDEMETLPLEEIPYGKPFTTTLDAGNLPDSKGSPADDLNVYYNYDYFNEQKDSVATSIYMALFADEYKNNSVKYIEDESITAPGMDQLRLFYEQAMDMETADERDIQDVQPYLDMIDKAESIEAFNEVLSSEDFPFSPFMTTTLTVVDTSADNMFAIYPNYILYDFLDGANYLQDADSKDDEIGQTFGTMANLGKLFVIGEALVRLGIPEEETAAVNQTLTDFEKQYAKYAFYDELVLSTEYGELGQYYNLLTFDELGKRLKNFPVCGILAKDGRDNSKFYSIMCVEWMEKLDELWTAKNLDTLKMIAKVKVLSECAPYLNSKFEKANTLARNLLAGKLDDNPGLSVEEQEINVADRAYNACDTLDTFSHLIAQVYVDNYVGSAGKERMKKLAGELKAAYIDIFEKTSWLDKDSKAALLDKLEKMSFNILEPQSGFIDFSGLKLVPAEEGGTLVGNYITLKKYRLEQENKLIGQPADTGYLFNVLKPSTLNCFYSSEGNCINILPGFICSGIYQDSYSDEELLGGIGYVVAHEISHGFDNIGSQYDGNGALNCCFTAESLDKYLELCNNIKEYYDGIYVSNGRNVDGNKVLAEACADLCGMNAMIECAEGKAGFDYDKFYERVALDYRDVSVRGTAMIMLMLDTHPLGNLRINVNAQMNDKFYEVFDVKEGDNMYVAPEDRLYLYGK